MHYLSSCSGFFEPSTSDPSQLTPNMINVTCVARPSGYTFSLGSILQQDINPSIRELADEVASKVKNVDTGPWVGVWYLGISTSGVTLVDIPFTFSGRMRNMNWWNFMWSGVVSTLLSVQSWHELTKLDHLYVICHFLRPAYRSCDRHLPLWRSHW